MLFQFQPQKPKESLHSISTTGRKTIEKIILHPVDQPLADLDLEKQHGKVIQQRGGARNKLLEKGMKTPSLVINLLTSISNCYYWRKIHKEGCQSSP